MTTTTTITFARVGDLELRDHGAWWTYWGQVGKQAAARDPTLTPGLYYGQLLIHMQDSGPIDPLIVGPWSYGKPGQLYVHDGHHRFMLARSLGWEYVPVVPAGDEYVNSRRWEPANAG